MFKILAVCYTSPVVLILRIWCWIWKLSVNWYLLYSHHLSVWYCFDNERKNYWSFLGVKELSENNTQYTFKVWGSFHGLSDIKTTTPILISNHVLFVIASQGQNETLQEFFRVTSDPLPVQASDGYISLRRPSCHLCWARSEERV